MSKDFFRVKKGLNIKPTDPTTVTDLEDGDIIVDSTDNQLKKYSEEDGEFSTIAGSGGTVANFFSDFDKLTPTVSNATVADDSVTFLPIDDNKKSKKATFSAAGSVLYQVASEADLEGNQGLMTVWIKTSLNSVTVSTTTDGAVQSTLSVLGTNKWKQYEIPFVVGGTDQGFIVEAGEAGDVFIDEPFVGLAPAGYVSKIATTIEDWKDFTVTSPTLTYSQLEGRYKRVGDSALIKITGVYSAGTGGIQFGFSEIGTADPTKYPQDVTNNFYGNGAKVDIGANKAYAMLPFISGNLIRFYGHDGLGTAVTNATYFTMASGDKVSLEITVPIQGWSTDYSTVVTQNTELTAQTANEFSARIAENGIVLSENYDFINGNCTENASSPFAITCNFNSNVFSVIPSCTASVFSGADVTVQHTVKIEQLSTSSIELRRNANDDISSQVLGIELHCSKQGNDVNKSATIIGKFENINSSDLVKVIAAGNSGQEITAATEDIEFIEVEDNYNAWNGTVFTVPKTSYYLFTGGVDWVNAGVSGLYLYVNGSIEQYIGFTSSTISNARLSGAIKLNQGDTVSIRSSITETLLNNPPIHNLQITELPDTQSIVKNLLAESSQTKCQTKYLSANVNTNTTLTDLTFSNLTIGKKYRVYFSGLLTPSSDSSIGVLVLHNGATVTNQVCGNNVGVSQCKSTSVADFTASTTTLTFDTDGFANTSQILFGNGAANFTFARLCQLPDTYVDTDEW